MTLGDAGKLTRTCTMIVQVRVSTTQQIKGEDNVRIKHSHDAQAAYLTCKELKGIFPDNVVPNLTFGR